MNRRLLYVLAVVCLFFVTPDGNAQTPYLQVYFDELWTTTHASCPPEPLGTVVGTMYVVANDFGAWIRAFEFKIDYPTQIQWLVDEIPQNALKIGASPTGIAIAWTPPPPLNGYEPALVLTAHFTWMCQDCSVTNILVCITGHPASGFARAVRWPDNEFIYAQSGTSVICGACGSWGSCSELPTPVATTTWGAIKAQYR
jgi:hypothetical protein